MDSQKFLAFWGLSHLPWNQPVAMDRIFWQTNTQATCARLLLNLQKAGRMSVIIAPPGHGKSTLARWLYHNINPRENDVALFSLMKTETEAGWLLEKLQSYLGIEGEKNPQLTLRKLQETYASGKVLTIIIDNAHQLAEPEAFEEILSLSHVQAITTCKVNFVLIGNPKLQTTLQRMPDAQHRLGMVADIPPFNRTELQAYISQRMQELNISRRTMQPEALSLFAQQGILTFAAADSLLESCLFEAFMRDRKIIDGDIVMFALEASGMKKPREDMASQNAKIAGSQKKRASPAVAKGGQQASGGGDLNSLFYKTTQDPDE